MNTSKSSNSKDNMLIIIESYDLCNLLIIIYSVKPDGSKFPSLFYVFDIHENLIFAI